MNDKVNNLYIRLRSMLTDKRLPELFDTLRSAAVATGDSSLASAATTLEARYFYMLRFIAGGGDADTTADTHDVFNQLKRLIAGVQRHMLEADSNSAKGAQLRYQQMRPEENLSSLFSDYLAELQRLRSAGFTLDSRAKAEKERLAGDIFRYLWASLTFDDDEKLLIMSMISDDDIPQTERVLWTHALGLGFEPDSAGEHMGLLLEALSADDIAVSAAARIWLALAALQLTDNSSQAVAKKLYDILETKFPGELNRIGLRYLSLLEKKKDAPAEDKLSDADREYFKHIAEGSISPENIDESFKDRAVDYFNKQFASGADFMASMFVPVYAHPFFGQLVNWFVPYSPDHSSLWELNEGEGAAITDSVAGLNMLNDLDKYATVLSILSAPPTMRPAMMSAIIDRLRSFSAMTGIDIVAIQPELTAEQLTDNYLLAIRRFSLYGGRNKRYSVSGIFTNCRLDANSLFSKHANADTIARAADILMSLGYNRQAFAFYNILPAEQISADVLTKMALDSAASSLSGSISLLEKALKQSPDRADIVLALAQHIKRQKGTEAAVKIYDEFLTEYPDTPEILEAKENTLELSGNYDEAIKAAEHLLYLDGENTAYLCALARLDMLAGDFDGASAFIEGIDVSANDNPTPEEVSLKASAMWCSGRHDEALAILSRYIEADAQSIGTCEAVSRLRDSIYNIAIKMHRNGESLRAAADIIYYQYSDTQFGKLI